MRKTTEHFLNIATFVTTETHKRKYSHETLDFLVYNLKELDKFFREMEEDNPVFEEERTELIMKNASREDL